MRNLAIALNLLLVAALLTVASPTQAFWATNGLLVRTSTATDQNAEMIPDGEGGIFIAWEVGLDVYAQRLDANGNRLWGTNGVAVCTAVNAQSEPKLIPDGAGGVIITWSDARPGTNANDIYAQHIAASGAVQWTANGVAVCTAAGGQFRPDISSDGAGGAIITWDDYRIDMYNRNIYAQRISSSGTAEWTANGVVICAAANNQGNPRIVTDGAGGAIILWEDARSTNSNLIYAQRVSTAGVVQWTSNGVALFTSSQYYYRPQIISDGAGGAFITCSGSTSLGDKVFAQRINSSGVAFWATNGVAVSDLTGSDSQVMVSDGINGAIIAFIQGDLDVRAQRLDASGTRLWGTNGMMVCDGTTTYRRLPRIASDGFNGAVVAWEDERNGSTNDDIYAQRVTSNGTCAWPTNGIAACTAPNTQMLARIAAASPGRAIIAWQDYRSGSNYDLYAQETAPPALTAALARSPFRIDATFDESLDTLSAQTAANFQVFETDHPGTTIAVTNVALFTDMKSVGLFFADSVVADTAYRVRAQNIKASDGVIMPAADTIDVAFGFPPTVDFTDGPSEGQGISVDTLRFAWLGHSDMTADNQLTYQFSLDDDAPSAWSSDTSVVLSDIGDGLHTFTVWVRDDYGNIGSAVRGFSVYLYGHGMLALFADPEGTDCDLDIGLYQTKDLYLFYVRGNGPILGNALEFRIRSSTTGAVLLTPEWSGDIALTMGDVNSGISLTGTRCLGITQIGDTLDKVYIGKIPTFNISETDTFNMRIVDDPNASPPGTYITACDRYNTLVDIFGGALTFNGQCNSEVESAVAPTRITVDIRFSQLVDNQSAITPANYLVHVTGDPTNIVPILGAELLASQSDVRLTLADSLDGSVSYTLRLYGVLGINGEAIGSGQDFPVEIKFPDIALTAGPAEGQHSSLQSVVFAWQGTSGITPVDSLLYSYRLDGGTQSAWSHDTTTTLPGIPEGNHYFIVWVKDQNGTTEWADRHFIVDITPPAYSVVAYPGENTNGYVGSTTVSITGSAADGFTSSDTIYTSASLDTGYWTPWQKQPSGDPTHTFSFDSLSVGVAHAISVRARDLAGNISTFTTVPFSVDVVAPETWFVDYESKSLHDVCAVSSTVAFAVGDGGNILRYDGTSWNRMPTGTAAALEAVWASAPDDAYAVGEHGIILHYSGTGWDSIPSGTSERLYDVWGSSASDVYAVGADGTILRFDGAAWNPMSSGTHIALYGVWGSSATDVFAVGAHGTIIHYDGMAWTSMAIGTDRALFAVWGTASNSVYAVGKDQLVLQYNGVAWSFVSGPGAVDSGLDYTSVWGSAANDVYVVEHAPHLYDPGVSSQRSTLLHYDGSLWTAKVLNTDALVEAIHGSSGSDIHVVGMTNTIIHYGASTGKRILLYTTRNTGTQGGTRRYHYDENLPDALARDGFSVACHDRESMPTLTNAILGGYDQLWLVSTEATATFTTAELEAIRDFHNAGKGILILGDHSDFDGPANAVSSEWHVSIGGTANRCGSLYECALSTSGFTSHAIWSGVASIQGNTTEGIITASAPAQVIAVSGSNMVAVYNVAGEGRVVWDASFLRFRDAQSLLYHSIAFYNNAQYARNVAAWLSGSGNSWSVVKDWRAGGELFGSVASPVTLTVAGSDDQTPADSIVYEFRPSNEAWSLQTGDNWATLPLPSVPDGAHAVIAQAADYVDNADAIPPAYSFLMDRTAPAPVIMSGPAADQPVLIDSVRFCWSATDNLASLDQLLFSYALDGEAPSEWTSWQSDHCASYSSLTYGAHIFTVWAKDLLGNTASIARTFNIDAMHDPLANGSDPYFIWRQSTNVQWKTDEDGYLTGPNPGTESWYEAVVGRRKFATSGNPYAICRMKHTAGGSNFMFGFGDTDPNTTNFYWQNIDFGVYIHSSNPLLVLGVTGTPLVPPPTLASGVYDILISINQAANQVGVSVESVPSFDAPPSDFIAPLWSATYSKTISAPINYLQINPYSTAMRVYDVWANRDTSDIVPPETEIVSGPAEGSVVDTSIAAFAWTGSDDKTPTAELVYASRLDETAYSAFAASTSRTLTGLADGSHTFSVKARDGAWNEDPSPATRSFVVDATSPSISITGGPAPGQHLTATETTFSWTASDLISPPESLLFSYRLDDDAYSAWDTIQSVTLTTLSEGSHVFSVRAIDEVGHVGSLQRSFFVDLTPPETEIVLGPQDGGWSPATITVTWTGADNVSHADSISFSHRLDEEAWSAWSREKSMALGAMSAGDHAFRVRAMDLAGHIDETPDSTSFIVVETATAVSGPITTNTIWTIANSPYIVTGDVIVRGAAENTTATLTIEPGVEVRFYQSTGLYVGDPTTGAPYYYGAISAHGTELEPIVFTSNAIVPSPGDWKGIYFTNEIMDAATTLSRCAVLYGGHTNGSNIYCYGATPAALEYLELSHSSGWGMITSSTAASIHNSSFSDNPSGGVQNLTPGTPIDAVYNWWGSPSGPSGAGPGTGQGISSGVLYDPWLLREPAGDAAAPSVSFTTAPAEGAYVSAPLVAFAWAGTDDTTPPDSVVYSHSLDGNPYSAWSPATAIDLTLAEGSHVFRVRARDLVGRISEVATRAFSYDVTPPNAQITAGPPIDGWIGATSAQFTWTGTDNVAPADSLLFSYMLDQAPWSAYAKTTSASFASLAEGPHTFMVKAKDLAGLEDTTPDTLSFAVDTVPPETEIVSGPPEGGTIDTSGVTVAWSGSDDRTPGTQIVFASRLDAGDYSPFSPDTVRTFVDLGDGPHSISVKARDLALNEDATPAQRSFIVDRSAPEIVFTAGPPDGHFQTETSVAFCWNGTDQYTPQSAIQYAYRLDGGARSAWSTDSCATLSSLPEGSHLFEAWARDSLGNEGHIDRAFVIDATGPAVVITFGPADGGWSRPDVTFNWTGSDNLAPGDSLRYSYRLDDALWSDYSGVSTHAYTSLPAAEHTFRLRARDIAGNVGDSLTVHFTVDGVPPETEITTGPAENAIISPALGPVLFAWTGTDDFTPADSLRFAYRLDNAAWSTFGTALSANVNVNIANGSHTFMVKARDLASNEDATPAQRSFIVDGSAPTIAFTSGPAAGQYIAAAEVSLCWVATDNQSPLDSVDYSVKLDAAEFGPWTPDSCASFVSLAEGSHTVTVSARDEAGNIGAAARSFFIDLTPPAATIVSGPAQGSFAGATVTYTWSGTDNLTAANSIVFSYRMDENVWSAFSTNKTATFSALSDGSHTFKLRARDLAANIGDSIAVTFEVDLAPPETWIVSGPAAGGVVDTTVARFSWAGSDDATPASDIRYSYKIDAAAYSAFSTDTSATFANLADGSHTFTVKARDLSLNEDPTPVARSFVVDAKGPVIAFVVGPAAGAHIAVAEVDFAWSGTDVISPPESLTYSYRIDGEPSSDWTAGTTATVSNLTQGTHTFSVSGRDVLGNIGTGSRSFTVDLAPPTVQVTSGPANGACWPQTTATFGWAAQDNFSTSSDVRYAYAIDADPYSAWATSASKTYTGLSSGAHVFHVKAKDKAGNETAYPTDVAFTVGNNDLVVTDVGVADSAYCNRQTTISWTVLNQGSCPVSGTYSDRVSISSDSLVGSDTQIGSFSRSGVLEAGQSYTVTQEILLPDNISGNFWIVIATDAGSAIPEEGFEGNNTSLSGRFVVQIPAHPDLRVANIAAPSEGYAGRGVYIDWTVENRGTDIARGRWTEYVYLSNDAIPGSDTKLSEFNYDYTLGVEETDNAYTHTHPITFPADISGDFWIIVSTDAKNDVSEYEWESNNFGVSAQPVHISPTPYPNLTVTSVQVPPDSASSNDEIEISWVVTNSGNEATNAPVWYDKVYLSPTPQLGATYTVLGEFENLSYLSAGQSYNQQNRKVKIPKQTANGTYYIVVATDSRNNVYEHVNEGDNARASAAMPVRYVPYPRPDLVVTNFMASLTGWAGNQIRISYRVSNIGNDAATGFTLTDWLWMAADSIIDPHHAVHIGGDIAGEVLAPAASYDRTVDITLPNDISGKRYLYVWTDVNLYYDDPDLDNNFSSISPIQIRIPPTPDLVVSNLSTASATVQAGATLRVEWTVANAGAGPGYVSAWRDAIYLSEDDTLNTATDTRLVKVYHSGSLEPDTSYTRAYDVTVPSGTEGARYIFAYADIDGEVPEGEYETNNASGYAVPITVTPPPVVQLPESDLRVTSVWTEGEARSGTAIPVSWTSKNMGPDDIPVVSWYDRVYLSADSILSTSSDPLLISLSHAGPLPVNATYSVTQNAAIPNGYSGAYYLFVQTDATGKVNEPNHENDNVTRIPLAISLTPPPDLIVSELIAPAETLLAGQSGAVQWTVRNEGTGATVAATWSDKLYLSTDNVLSVSTDKYLQTFAHTGSLGAGQFYQQNRSVTIPTGYVGSYYIIAITDADGAVYEHTAEGNNTRAALVNLAAPPQVPPPNLVADALAFVDGLKDTIRYSVRNAGVSSVPATQRSWTDRVYLSTDATLDKATDAILVTFNRTGDLVPGASYVVTREVTLPSGTSGEVYLFAVTDATEKVTEASETDNAVSQAQVIELSYADLQVASVTCPATAPTGQLAKVAWSIRNLGNGLPVPETWYNGVYLSRDRILDETDYSLGSKYHQGGLAVGASRADSLSVTIPAGLSGTYYFFVKTDRNNTVYEYDREDNNIGYAQGGIAIFIPPPDADLVISDVTPPAGTVSGDTISIAWTVTNESEIPLTAQWRDAVYVSPDTIWDLSDSYLGEVPHTSGLGAGARYVQTLDVAAADYFGVIDAIVPGLVPGSYHIVVRADIRNNVVESNESNNEGYSVAGMPIDVRELAMGSTEASHVGARERRYFKLQASPGTDIRFYLACFGVYDELEMYVRFGAVPDRITYDYYERISAAEQVIVPGSASEYCYIMIYGDYVPGSGDFSIRPEAFLFAVSKVDPTTVDNAGVTTLSVIGGQLDEAVSVTLVNEEGASIEALDFSVPNSTNIEARFDLRGSAFGVYDVTVATASADTAVLASAVTIVPGQGADVQPDIQGPDAIRQSITSDYVINLENVGTADAYDVVSALVLSSGTLYRLILDNVTTAYRVCLGETVLVHTNRIGVGKSAQYIVRIQGLSSLGVEILSINGEPILASTPSGTAIVSTLATGCAQAFADQLQEDGTSIDRAAFNEAFASAWASAWGMVLSAPLRGETDESAAPKSYAELDIGTGDPVVSSSLDDKITQSTLSALETIGDPLVPPYVTGVTEAGIEASIEESDVYVKNAILTASYKRKLKDVTVRVAKDPNEKYGPAEAGGDAEVSQLESVPYTIYFENMPDASAAARQVVVSDFLDANFDWRRFRLGEIAFGSRVISVPPNKSYYHTTVNLDSLGMLLEIDAGVNSTTGEAAWTFTTIDPSTGLPPVDPNAGFLPPNDETGRGQGHVFFTIVADPEIPDGTAIENRARIVFDLNSAIETNESEIFVHRVYPDLEIVSAAGQSAYPTFIEGEPVTIEATIANGSDASASTFSVAFFDGDPDNGGVMIGSPRLIPGIAGNAEVTVDASWTPLRSIDQHPIYIRADFYDGVVESDETNNGRILVLGAQPKTYTASFAQGLTTVSLPLEPLEPYTARSFADLLGATQIIRYDTAGIGLFESFVVEQSGDGFPIRPNEGYIAALPGPCSVTFSGITNRDTASVETGLNFISLPLDLGPPCTARQYCDLLGGTMVIRFNRTMNDFEAFIPDFHSGGGFDINAARGYFIAADTSRTVVLAGSGWMGVESSPPVGMPPTKSDDNGNATTVLGVTGTVYQQQWGRQQLLMPGCTAIARDISTNAQIALKIDDATGQFSGAFVALPGSARIKAGDKLQILVTTPDGQPAGGAAEYVVTKEDIARTYVRTDLTVSAATPAMTLLYQNFPNPFNPVTSIRYQLSKPGHVKLRVYSVAGQLIGTLVDEAQQPGYFQITWNGRNTEGRLIASGVYFYRLETPDYSKSFKMVILR
jgi:hypothetical protein